MLLYAGMSTRLVNMDRETPMFLPYDLREWVPENHIVHFILDGVEQIPTAHFSVNQRGTGSEQYPPGMMLALLIYCYATGRFGSRTIEAATYSDVAVRYLCANHHPDHASICAFRTANQAAPPEADEGGHGQRGWDQNPGECEQARRGELRAGGQDDRAIGT